jgi:hypothetical protein
MFLLAHRFIAPERAGRNGFRNGQTLPNKEGMSGKLEPASPATWKAYYRAADERRRVQGWHRRGESKAPRQKLTGSRLLAIVMGLATVVVIVCLVLPI